MEKEHRDAVELVEATRNDAARVISDAQLRADWIVGQAERRARNRIAAILAEAAYDLEVLRSQEANVLQTMEHLAAHLRRSLDERYQRETVDLGDIESILGPLLLASREPSSRAS